jgi:hypothetical protein
VISIVGTVYPADFSATDPCGRGVQRQPQHQPDQRRKRIANGVLELGHHRILDYDSLCSASRHGVPETSPSSSIDLHPLARPGLWLRQGSFTDHLGADVVSWRFIRRILIR